MFRKASLDIFKTSLALLHRSRGRIKKDPSISRFRRPGTAKDERENRRAVPRAAVLPERSLLSIARAWLHVRALREHKVFLHVLRRLHKRTRLCVVPILRAIFLERIGLAGPSRPAGSAERARARVPHDDRAITEKDPFSSRRATRSRSRSRSEIGRAKSRRN